MESFVYVDVTNTMRNGEVFWLKRSSMCWVTFIRIMVVEWSFLKPGREGEKGMWGPKGGRKLFFP